jgi:hypothetical protein
MANEQNIKKNCIDFFQNEDIKHYIKEIMKPLVQIIYDEIYLYVWIICMYNMFLFLFILAIFFLLINNVPNQIKYSSSI